MRGMKRRNTMILLAVCMLLTACGHTSGRNVETASDVRPTRWEEPAYDPAGREDQDTMIMQLDFGCGGTYKVTVRPFSTDAMRVHALLIKKEIGRLQADFQHYQDLFGSFLTGHPINRKIEQTIWRTGERNRKEYEIQLCAQ